MQRVIDIVNPEVSSSSSFYEKVLERSRCPDPADISAPLEPGDRYSMAWEQAASRSSFQITAHEETKCRVSSADFAMSHRGDRCMGRLTIMGNARAVRILFASDEHKSDNKIERAAVGVLVEPIAGGPQQCVQPQHDGEIVMCCGAFETPLLLERSLHCIQQEHDDVGDADDGVCASALGKGLQDHLIVPIMGLSLAHIVMDGGGGSVHRSMNGVHGWAFTNARGDVMSSGDSADQEPRLIVIGDDDDAENDHNDEHHDLHHGDV